MTGENGDVRWLVCLVLVAACGDNIHVIAPEELSAAYTDANCRYWVRCGVFPALDACRQVHLWRVDPDVMAAIDAGVVEFHGDVAEACVAWVDSLSCDPTDAAHREVVCSGVYTGTKHDGESCAFGEECISQECWLEGAACTDACCIGYCTGDTPPPVAGIGERCRYAPCAEGYCQDSLCVPLLGDGEECGTTAQCEIGLSCRGRCMRLPGAGEPCIDTCRDVGQHCNAITGRCERVAWRGEHCYVNDDCSPFYSCSIGQAGSVCSLAVVGDECSGIGTCALPAVCDFQPYPYHCINPRPDGASCKFGRDCVSGTCGWPSQTCASEACI